MKVSKEDIPHYHIFLTDVEVDFLITLCHFGIEKSAHTGERVDFYRKLAENLKTVL